LDCSAAKATINVAPGDDEVAPGDDEVAPGMMVNAALLAFCINAP
jgi:hypothetical protein